MKRLKIVLPKKIVKRIKIYKGAYKICAYCGENIPVINNGKGYMFCDLDCAVKYWKEVKK